jgi:AraC-like DNA-binding protein
MTDNLGSPAAGRFHNPARPAAGLEPPAGPLVRPRFAGAAVTVYEWRCTGRQHDSSRDEWSDAHEVVVPRRGAFVFQVEGRRVFADPTSAAFLHPDEAYRVRHPVPGGDAGSVFRLAPSGVAALVAEHDPSAAEHEWVRFPASGTPLDGRGYLLHRRAMRALDDAGTSSVEAEERAVAFVREAVAQACRRRAGVGRGRGPATRNRHAAEYARRVQEVLAARYREPLTLTEVARAVEASPFHLSRLVTAATGVPIHRMLVRFRLREALEQLLETRESIAFVALSAGFASHSHLTDAFRREYGVSPSEVRRAFRAPRPRTGCRRAEP